MSLRRRSGGGGGGGTSGGAAPRRPTPHSMRHSTAAGAGSARPTGRETRSLAASRGRGSAGSTGALGGTGVGRDGAAATRSSERQGADGGGAGGGGAAAAQHRALPTNAQVRCTRQPTPMQPDCLPRSASRPSRPACLPPRARLAPASPPPHPSPSLASCPPRSCPPAPPPLPHPPLATTTRHRRLHLLRRTRACRRCGSPKVQRMLFLPYALHIFSACQCLPGPCLSPTCST